MLHSADITRASTIFPVGSRPCPSPQDSTASIFSYAIGPLAPEQIVRLEAPLPDGEVCSLLVPVALPRSILDHPAFRNGYQWGDLNQDDDEEPEEWTYSVPRLVNFIYMSLAHTRLSSRSEESDEMWNDLSWEVGWLLRELTILAERDATLAAVGMAHLCFLLPLLVPPLPPSWSFDACLLHDRAVKAYRVRVRLYREQGKSYEEAQRLALVILSHELSSDNIKPRKLSPSIG
ncbi:MAG TPA: hypothetical protein VFU49_10490 [Ktedonobacteraceae bacterium]|nr:hypothetical protein [Ktedonobacteraceae bacterium]